MRSRLVSILTGSVPPGPEALVWWLALAMSAGVTAVIPVLPLYAQRQGADLAFLGLMVAAYMAFNLLALYPAGWLSDRIGRRTLMAAGLAAYGLASLGFLVLAEPWAFVALRGVEGVAGACFTPAALAYVADRAPEHQRGTRIGQLTVAQNLGVLLGPVFGGGCATLWGLASPFAVLAALCGLGSLLVARLPHGPAAPAPAEAAAAASPVGWWRQVNGWMIAGLGARAFTMGLAAGLYETAWPLYMTRLGARPWDVSMSWTFFALPAVLLATPVGRLLDRLGPARPAVVGGYFSAVVTVAYALAPGVEGLLLLSAVDGLGFALAYPAASMLNVQAGPSAVRGRVLGVITAIGTFGSLTGALAMPVVYGRAPVWCFYLVGATIALGTTALAAGLAMAARPAGRAHEHDAISS